MITPARLRFKAEGTADKEGSRAGEDRAMVSPVSSCSPGPASWEGQGVYLTVASTSSTHQHPSIHLQTQHGAPRPGAPLL